MNQVLPKIILASGSPRRKMLLEQAGYQIEVCRPDDDAETPPIEGESPAQLVHRLAYAKTANVAFKFNSGIFVGADTVAACDGQILGKPADREDAKRMLSLMSGKRHFVLTGVCIWERPSNRCLVQVASTTLKMEVLNESLLEQFLDSGDWKGKAGAFGYQDGLDWIAIESGTATNVIGLPIEDLTDWLSEFSS